MRNKKGNAPTPPAPAGKQLKSGTCGPPVLRSEAIFSGMGGPPMIRSEAIFNPYHGQLARAAEQSHDFPAKQTQPSVNPPHDATNARFCYNITKISNPEPT
jgi:hypothetical protein